VERDLLRLIEGLTFGGEAPVSFPDTLRERVSRVRALRRTVEERWAELPQGIRESLGELTRSWGEDPVLLEEGTASEELEELLREVRLLFRAVADRLEESDPAFFEALRRVLAEEGAPLEKEELSRLILEP